MSDPLDQMPGDPDAALAGEYVLRLLGPEEEAAFAAREARDPEFAALVAVWRADLEGLDGAFPEASPPAGLERRISERLFGARPSMVARLWRSAPLWRGVAAAALLVALWFGLAAPPPVAPPGEAPARLISALASVDSDVSLLAALEPQAAVLSINRTSGAPAPGRVLELWMIEGDVPPVSLGVLPDSPVARVPLTSEQASGIGPGTTLAVSDEPVGGSPTGAPTGPVVAAGPVNEI
jgi:anti-sigma-K factor RskA